MRRLLFFALGLLCGAAIGYALALMLTPASGDDLRTQVRKHVDHARHEAQRAAAARRKELEAQLSILTGPPQARPQPQERRRK
jgi:gas vesicle protein